MGGRTPRGDAIYIVQSGRDRWGDGFTAGKLIAAGEANKHVNKNSIISKLTQGKTREKGRGHLEDCACDGGKGVIMEPMGAPRHPLEPTVRRRAKEGKRISERENLEKNAEAQT